MEHAKCRDKDVAVVALSCRFPNADSHQAFWRNLVEGVDCIGEIPPERWAWQDYFGDPYADRNRGNSRWGGFMADAARFDAAFFGISPREAECMDPQQRLLMELTWHCLEQGGTRPESLAGRQVGVFVGACNYEYGDVIARSGQDLEGHQMTGMYPSLLANRLSYHFDFTGPSFTIDTACSSSLVAVHQAVQALRRGECEAALAGGVNLLASPRAYVLFSKLRMLSPTGSCKTFDAAADGYVRSEGGGLILLKRLSDAVAQGDRILGVIKGSAVNHGGHGRTLTSPDPSAQARLIRAALSDAELEPGSIGYVEAHGTGTPLGDPIEIEGIKAALGDGDGQPCWLGAVKSNVGHLESAAGIAGLIKILLAIQHEYLPANLHFRDLNPRISLDRSRFAVLDAPRPWQSAEVNGQRMPLRAGVSSFGIGGTNAHAVVEQWCGDGESSTGVAPQSSGVHAVLVSAASDAALKRLASEYADRISAVPQRWVDICRNAGLQRSPLACRVAAVADTPERMVSLLNDFSSAVAAPGVFVGQSGATDSSALAFVFTGQGAQYPGMGKALYDTDPVFRDALSRGCDIVGPMLDRDLLALMFTADAALLAQTRYTQPALFVLEYALYEWWRAKGIEPDLVAGHSLGEIVAACVAGVFSFEDAARLVVARARLMDSISSSGAMAAVAADADAVMALLAENGLEVDLAAVNGPGTIVVSGEADVMDAALGLLAQRGIETTRLQVSHAFHSRLQEPIQDEFLHALAEIEFHEPRLKLVSNLTGRLEQRLFTTAEYWVEHIRRPVLFRQGVEAMFEQGVGHFLELGPSPLLTALVRRTAGERPCRLFSSLQREAGDSRRIHEVLAELYVAGATPRPRRLDAGDRVELPLYPFVGERYWPTPARDTGFADTGVSAPFPGRQSSLAVDDLDIRCFELSLPNTLGAYLTDHRVMGCPVMPGAGYISLALAALRQAGLVSGEEAIRLYDIGFLKPLELSGSAMEMQLILQRRRDEGEWSIGFNGRVDPDAPWVRYAAARLESGPRQPASLPSLPTEPVGDEAGSPYPQLEAMGLTYGPAFQGIEVLTPLSNDRELLARVGLPNAVPPLPADAESLHPVVLDSAIQAAVALLDGLGVADRVPLPARIDSMTLYRPDCGPLQAHCRLHGPARADVENIVDIVLFDRQQRPVARIEGLKLVWVAKESVAALLQREARRNTPRSELAFVPTWYREEGFDSIYNLSLPPVSAKGVLIVFNEYGRTLQRALARLHSTIPCHSLCLGESSAGCAEGESRLERTDSAALEQALNAAGEFDTVFFLAALQPPRPELDPQTVAEAQEQGLMTLFRLLQQRAEHRREEALSVCLVTNGVFAVGDDEKSNPLAASAGGLLKAVAREIESWSYRHVDLALRDAERSEQTQQGVAALLTRVLQQSDEETALRSGRCYRRRWAVLPPSQGAQGTGGARLRQGGHYLLTGGMGGIGLELGRYLARHYGARLVLLGRSPLGAQQQVALHAIEAAGGQARYLSADLLDRQALNRAIAEARAAFGPLHGVFHCAGALHDQAFHNLTESAFRQVLAPKVTGTLNLLHALDEDGPDFVLLFSSIISLLGNAGQANYAAANAFIDALPRHSGAGRRAQVIDWGAWNIGMASDEVRQRQLQRQGLLALDPDEALAALEQCLESGSDQALVAKAQPWLLAQLGIAGGAEAAEPQPTPDAAGELPAAETLATLDEQALEQAVLQGVSQLVGQVLKIGVEREPAALQSFAQQRLTSLGIDSLTATDLRARVRNWVQVDLPAELIIGGAMVNELMELICQHLLLQRLSGAAQGAAAEMDEDVEVFTL